MTRSPVVRCRPLVAFLTLLASTSLHATDPPPEAPDGASVLLYRAIGVADSTTAATSVHCTNLGGSLASVTVQFVDFNAAVECSVIGSVPAGGSTRTFSSRLTAVFFDDYVCSAAPEIDQGQALIRAELAGSTNVVCTVQVVDPAALTPVFATQVELYRR